VYHEAPWAATTLSGCPIVAISPEETRTMSEPPNPARQLPLQVADLVPLAGFVIPTVIIGYGFVIPGSCIAGVNDLTIGFAISIVAASVTYVIGVRRALRRPG